MFWTPSFLAHLDPNVNPPQVKSLIVLQLTRGFQQWLAHLHSSWLVIEATSFSQQPRWTRIWHLAQNDNLLEGIMRSITMGTHDIPTLPKVTFDALKRVFLAKVWNFFQLVEKKVKLTLRESASISPKFPNTRLFEATVGSMDHMKKQET